MRTAKVTVLLIALILIMLATPASQAAERGRMRAVFVKLAEVQVQERGYLAIVVSPHKAKNLCTYYTELRGSQSLSNQY